MDLKARLKNYIKNLEDSPDYVTQEKQEKIEAEHFKANYIANLPTSEDSYKVIPKFYHKLPEANELLGRKLREEARSMFLQKKNEELVENTELKQLWSLLDKGDMFSCAEEHYLTYTEFKKLRDKVESKFKPFFTATVFGKLQRERPGCVAVDSLFNYVMRKTWYKQSRIGLSVYDPTGQGYLREHYFYVLMGETMTPSPSNVLIRPSPPTHVVDNLSSSLSFNTDADLDNYIKDLVPTLTALEALDPSFGSFYVCTASRKFLFFLDPLRTGRVRIIDILASNFLEEMIELREEDLPMEVQEKNWFSATSALRVYGQYLNLDTNHNGMLSLDELQGYGSGTLTRTFLARVFQQCLTYDGEMDYKTYLDLVLALEYRREPQSLQYLFRVLDIHGKGYLDGFTLNYFFKAIQEQMEIHGPVVFEDVKDEIFDMVKPADPTKITLQDLIASGQGSTAVSILIELQCFLAYEHRETFSPLPQTQD